MFQQMKSILQVAELKEITGFLKGTAIEKREFGNHIIISAVEHPAVTETAEQLVELGFELSYAPVDKEGRVKVEELQKLIRKETIWFLLWQ